MNTMVAVGLLLIQHGVFTPCWPVQICLHNYSSYMVLNTFLCIEKNSKQCIYVWCTHTITIVNIMFYSQQLAASPIEN